MRRKYILIYLLCGMEIISITPKQFDYIDKVNKLVEETISKFISNPALLEEYLQKKIKILNADKLIAELRNSKIQSDGSELYILNDYDIYWIEKCQNLLPIILRDMINKKYLETCNSFRDDPEKFIELYRKKERQGLIQDPNKLFEVIFLTSPENNPQGYFEKEINSDKYLIVGQKLHISINKYILDADSTMTLLFALHRIKIFTFILIIIFIDLFLPLSLTSIILIKILLLIIFFGILFFLTPKININYEKK